MYKTLVAPQLNRVFAVCLSAALPLCNTLTSSQTVVANQEAVETLEHSHFI